jgi:hypothetical protein
MVDRATATGDLDTPLQGAVGAGTREDPRLIVELCARFPEYVWELDAFEALLA